MKEHSSTDASNANPVSGKAILIQEVDSKRKLRRFIHLPAAIHKHHTNWVPPIYMDEWEFFDPKKNLSFQSCDSILLLAYRAKEVVGRIMGIIHRKYNTLHKENHARFAFFETFNDDEVAAALISAVESWSREKGMERLVGPLAFSEKDPQGFLIEGFDEPAVIASNCNFPYQVELLEKNAFTKEVELVVNDKNEVVAFVIGMSHIGDGIRKVKGKLFPFGIFRIFASARKSKQLNLLLGGIDPSYRSKGLDVMMGVKMLESAKALGKTTIDSHLELEHNTKVRAEMEKLGGRVYKRFRVFSKNLKE